MSNKHAGTDTLRHLYRRTHWGPINRREVEIKSAAEKMLIRVQEQLTAPHDNRAKKTRAGEVVANQNSDQAA
jgi:hypothetical protein